MAGVDAVVVVMVVVVVVVVSVVVLVHLVLGLVHAVVLLLLVLVVAVVDAEAEFVTAALARGPGGVGGGAVSSGGGEAVAVITCRRPGNRRRCRAELQQQWHPQTVFKAKGPLHLAVGAASTNLTPGALLLPLRAPTPCDGSHESNSVSGTQHAALPLGAILEEISFRTLSRVESNQWSSE